jgi:hypothetical protein
VSQKFSQKSKIKTCFGYLFFKNSAAVENRFALLNVGVHSAFACKQV